MVAKQVGGHLFLPIFSSIFSADNLTCQLFIIVEKEFTKVYD